MIFRKKGLLLLIALTLIVLFAATFVPSMLLTHLADYEDRRGQNVGPLFTETGSVIEFRSLVRGDVVCVFPPKASYRRTLKAFYKSFTVDRWTDSDAADTWLIADVSHSRKTIATLVSIEPKQVEFNLSAIPCGTSLSARVVSTNGRQSLEFHAIDYLI